MNKAERVAAIADWRDAQGCYMCGGHERLEFHHINPEEKAAKVRELATCSPSRIIEEIRKCVVLCGRCHRITHRLMRS